MKKNKKLKKTFIKITAGFLAFGMILPFIITIIDILTNIS